MYHRWAALALVLALCAVPTKQAAGQQTATSQPRERKLGSLGQNFPNPFNPETRFPFSVDVCDGGVSTHVVTLKVYNVLAQVIAVPVLEGVNRPLEKLTLPCGQYTAFWDGKVLGTGKEAASGVYTYVLEIDGQRTPKKAFVAK